MEPTELFAVLLPLITLVVYATIGFLANKTGSDTETSFNPKKVVTVFIIALILAVINFLQGNMLTVDQLIALIPTYSGIFYLADKTVKTVVNAKTTVENSVTTTACKPTTPCKMSQSVKEFLIAGETPADQAIILNKIAAAEAAELYRYEIQYSRGYYKIENCQAVASGRD